jgi:hypothetical protein
MSTGRPDARKKRPEARLASELPPVDCGDFVERVLQRMRERSTRPASGARSRIATRAQGRPERFLSYLPVPSVGGLLRRTLLALRSPAQTAHIAPFRRRPRRRRLATNGLMSMAAAAIVVILWRPPPQAPVEPTPVATPNEVVVRKTDGRVHVSRGDGRAPATVGEGLGTGDVLVTVGNAEAVLSVGEHGVVVVDPFSKIRVGRSGQAERASPVPSLEVLRGRAEGRLRQRQRSAAFQFTVAGKNYGLLEGSLGVVRLGTNRFVLAAVSDAVVQTDGREVTVPAANLLRVAPGSDDSDVRPVPWSDKVTLALRQKRPIAADDATTTLVGQTSPDVVLFINAIPVPVGKDGRFVATLNVRRGAAAMEAVVRDPLGRVQRKQVPIIRAKTRVNWRKPG